MPGQKFRTACSVYSCGASVKVAGHVHCPYHALCHQNGSYVPDSCRRCRSNLVTVAETPVPEHANTSAWMEMDSTIRHLRNAVRRAPPLGELFVTDTSLFDWFSDAWG